MKRGGFFAELKRRNVFRATILYLGGSKPGPLCESRQIYAWFIVSKQTGFRALSLLLNQASERTGRVQFAAMRFDSDTISVVVHERAERATKAKPN
jgi:hypothetical protein